MLGARGSSSHFLQNDPWIDGGVSGMKSLDMGISQRNVCLESTNDWLDSKEILSRSSILHKKVAYMTDFADISIVAFNCEGIEACVATFIYIQRIFYVSVKLGSRLLKKWNYLVFCTLCSIVHYTGTPMLRRRLLQKRRGSRVSSQSGHSPYAC